MDNFVVREKANPLHIHCLTWSQSRGEKWIDQYGDSKMFMDKTLTRDSFEVVPNVKAEQAGKRRNRKSKANSQGVHS